MKNMSYYDGSARTVRLYCGVLAILASSAYIIVLILLPETHIFDLRVVSGWSPHSFSLNNMPSGAVRARRPPSPPPTYPQSVPRFPPKEGHLDADERRAAASLGYGPSRKPARAYAPGGYNITPGEWKLLLAVVVIASAVRLFRISKPNSVVCVISF